MSMCISNAQACTKRAANWLTARALLRRGMSFLRCPLLCAWRLLRTFGMFGIHPQLPSIGRFATCMFHIGLQRVHWGVHKVPVHKLPHKCARAVEFLVIIPPHFMAWLIPFASVSFLFKSSKSTYPTSPSNLNPFPTLFGVSCQCNLKKGPQAAVKHGLGLVV